MNVENSSAGVCPGNNVILPPAESAAPGAMSASIREECLVGDEFAEPLAIREYHRLRCRFQEVLDRPSG